MSNLADDRDFCHRAFRKWRFEYSADDEDLCRIPVEEVDEVLAALKRLSENGDSAEFVEVPERFFAEVMFVYFSEKLQRGVQ